MNLEPRLRLPCGDGPPGLTQVTAHGPGARPPSHLALTAQRARRYRSRPRPAPPPWEATSLAMEMNPLWRELTHQSYRMMMVRKPNLTHDTDPSLTRMARSACALTACEPVGELTWGELTMACSLSRGTDGLCAFGRSAGLPGRRASRPGLSRARGPAHRAGPQDLLPSGEGSVGLQAHRTGVVGCDRKRHCAVQEGKLLGG